MNLRHLRPEGAGAVCGRIAINTDTKDPYASSEYVTALQQEMAAADANGSQGAAEQSER